MNEGSQYDVCGKADEIGRDLETTLGLDSSSLPS